MRPRRVRIAALCGCVAASAALGAHAGQASFELSSGAEQLVSRPLGDDRYEVRISVRSKMRSLVDAEERIQGQQRIITLGPVAHGELHVSREGVLYTVSFAGKAAAPAATLAAATAMPLVAAAPPPAPQAAAKPEATAAQAAKASGAAASAAVSKEVSALQAKAQDAVDSYKNYLVDMSIPTSPAFAVLGATPKTIIEPGNPRDFAVSLAQNLSNSDALGNGVGFDFAPYMAFYGSTLTLGRYQGQPALATLARTQLSFGAIKSGAGTATASTKAAVGLSIPLMDESDARRRGSPLADCYRDAMGDLTQEGYAASVKAAFDGKDDVAKDSLQVIADKFSTQFDKCRQDYKKNFWNASKWSLGWGQAWNHSNGATQRATQSVWSTYAMRLGAAPKDVHTAPQDTQGQVLLHLRRTTDEKVDMTTDPRGFAMRDSTLGGLGVKVGSQSLAFSAEATRSSGHYDNGTHENARKFALGAEYQINKDVWFVLSVGGQGGYANGKNSPFVLGSVKFGAASESTGAFGAAAK